MARIFVAAMAAVLVMVLGVAPSQAQKAYISSGGFGTEVYDTQTQTFTQITPEQAVGMTVSPDGNTVDFIFPNFGFDQFNTVTNQFGPLIPGLTIKSDWRPRTANRSMSRIVARTLSW
jgi:hypothetical protein